MSIIVIYYQQQKHESVKDSIERVKNLIKNLETSHNIVGVFIDSHNDRNLLNEMLNTSLDEIDILYMNKPIDDEFYSKLLNQLSKIEQFIVKYIDEI